MASPIVIFAIGVLVTGLWAIFIYVSVRGVMRTEMPQASFDALLEAAPAVVRQAVRVLLAIDGSPASVAAVNEVARCPLPSGSAIEVLVVIHSRVPVVPDFPPWAVTVAATHGESIREQTRAAPELLQAAVSRLQFHHRQVAVTTKLVEGEPKDEILREAEAWKAERIVLGSHGRGRVERVLLGSTAAGVAADATCTVHIVRTPARPEPAESGTSSDR